MENNHFVEDRISDNLIFFGVAHTKNLVEISKLIEAIREFNPDIILIEGGFEKATFRSEEEAIEKGGEMGAVSFFAKKNVINLLPNDPDQKDEFDFMIKEFGRDFTLLYFVLRNSNYRKQKIDQNVLNEIKNLTKWENFDFSLQNFKRIFFGIINESFDENKNYSDYFNPTLSINKLNSATQELNEFRDNFMVGKLKSLIKENKKIGIVKGSYHLFKNKDEIRKLTK